MKSLWSIRFLRPWLFRRWERKRREILAAEGRSGNALAVGAPAPRFDLPDDRGRVRRSEEWFGRGRVVLWFTNLCELCADQAGELSQAGWIRRSGAKVVAVHLPGGSAPSPSDFRRDSGAEFPVLVDGGAVTRAWTGEAVPDT